MDTNPILNELQGLSPGAQQALMAAHTAASSPLNPPQIAKPQDAGPAPTAPTNLGMAPAATPSLQAPPPPNVTQAPPPKMALGTEGGDQQERQRLLNTGSGISQIHNPVLHGLAAVGNTVGGLVAPGLMRAIPGTEEHHNLRLGQTEKNLGNDLTFGQKQATEAETNARTGGLNATTAKTNVETAGLPQEQADKHVLSTAQTGNLNSETEHRGDVKDDWKELSGYTGPKGEPLEINSATGETRPANSPGATRVAKETNPQQQTYDSLIKQGLTPMQAYEKIREKPAGVSQAGTWTLAEGEGGKATLYNSKTGEMKDAPQGLQKAGTQAKKDAATAPAQQALNYADDYGKRSVHTGSGDEALMEKFFELAKPSTGFRMSQPQIDMLKNAQSWMGGLEAHLRHATTGTWFSDDQRKEIINTMHDLGTAKGIGGDVQPPAGADNEVYVGGKLVGHTVGGKYVPLGGK